MDDARHGGKFCLVCHGELVGLSPSPLTVAEAVEAGMPAVSLTVEGADRPVVLSIDGKLRALFADEHEARSFGAAPMLALSLARLYHVLRKCDQASRTVDAGLAAELRGAHEAAGRLLHQLAVTMPAGLEASTGAVH